MNRENERMMEEYEQMASDVSFLLLFLAFITCAYSCTYILHACHTTLDNICTHALTVLYIHHSTKKFSIRLLCAVYDVILAFPWNDINSVVLANKFSIIWASQ